ncbi:MAG: hypothetical protein M3R13_02365 [Armatimonadota bacterium]|nr:hypothetical protein [Armatimonadota bacterium]
MTAMAYDSRRGVIVLFGGGATDTWEFDGTSWRQVASAGPSLRYFAPMVYDQARGKTVLHGGSSGWIGSPLLSDTWEWNGVVWNRIEPVFPGPKRSFHTLTYDSRRRLTVLVGGGGPYTLYTVNDTWEYDGSTWRKSVAPQEIYARQTHATAYHEGMGKVAVFGGRNYPRRYSDLWLFNGKSWVNDDPAPPAFSRPTMVYDRRRGNFVQFGGGVTGLTDSISDLQAETWILEAESGWRKAKPATNPRPRTHAAMVYDEGRGEVLMFGGYVVGRGGYNYLTSLRDMWIWNGSDWREVNPDGPRPHSSGPMFYDTRLQKTVLLSFKSGSQSIQVVWLWDGRSWTETTIQPPYASTNQPELVYDPISKQAIARFWGDNETWLWNGSSWKFAYSDTGRDRGAGSFTFDESANKAFYYGGADESSTLSDALFWNGSMWHELGHQPPGPRAGAGAAYDSVLARSVIFGGLAVVYGGIDVEFYDDTWAVRWVP